MSTTKVGTPGALIAALPAVLGFEPTESLIVAALGPGNKLMAALRADLSEFAHKEAFTDLAELVRRAGALSAIAVIVNGDDAEQCPMCATEAAKLCERLQAALTGEGIDLLGCHVVARIAAGVRWVCADGCGTEGVVDDPAESLIAAQAVMAGRRVSGSRAEVEASLAHSPDDAVAELVAAIPALSGRGDEVAALETALEVIGDGAQTADAAAVLAPVLANRALRDVFLGLAGTELADRAEAVLLHAARVLPWPRRADALACVAFLAYCRGDGPLVGMAVDAGQAGAPEHHLLGLLDAALRGGIRPEAIRPMAQVARDGVAEKFGVTVAGGVA